MDENRSMDHQLELKYQRGSSAAFGVVPCWHQGKNRGSKSPIFSQDRSSGRLFKVRHERIDWPPVGFSKAKNILIAIIVYFWLKLITLPSLLVCITTLILLRLLSALLLLFLLLQPRRIELNWLIDQVFSEYNSTCILLDPRSYGFHLKI